MKSRILVVDDIENSRYTFDTLLSDVCFEGDVLMRGDLLQEADRIVGELFNQGS